MYEVCLIGIKEKIGEKGEQLVLIDIPTVC